MTTARIQIDVEKINPKYFKYLTESLGIKSEVIDEKLGIMEVEKESFEKWLNEESK